VPFFLSPPLPCAEREKKRREEKIERGAVRGKENDREGEWKDEARLHKNRNE